MSFLPEGYSMPSNSKYMKLEKGTNKFRILDSAVIGYEWWEEVESGRKPFRVTTFKEAVAKGQEPIKHFWAFPIWNYTEKKVQVLELTQKTIMAAITAYVQNEDWGDPKDYDLTITKDGDGLDTNYTVIASPHKGLTEEVTTEWKDTQIDLTALFRNEDPFSEVSN